tara:strand:- start:3093 stop:4337 length:1245 start_codon:yes stop_codon:yes gene_type:complete
MPFISLIDDRAKPKGSRDPLGFELVWTHFGRKVVGNLTTITSSLENFAVALLGFHWANELNIHVDEDHKQKAVRETFLRYEQITGYIRYYGKSNSIMGITRVKERILFENKRNTLNIGLGADEQILSDQASYGMWGLYSTAMRDTGLVIGNERTLTDKGLAIASGIEKQLKKTVFLEWIKSNSVRKEELEVIADSYMQAIKTPELVSQLLEALMMGSEGNLIQQELWQKTNDLFKNKQFLNDRTDKVGAYIASLKTTELSASLRKCLLDIEKVERVLVALNNIFHYCRVKDGVMINDVIKNLQNQAYSFAYLPDVLPDTKFPRKQNIQLTLSALKAGDYKLAIQSILKLNDSVMRQRNGAAWVEVEGNGKLRVRVKSETASLATLASLEERWDYDYFLGSYLSMATAYLGDLHE